MHPVIYDVAVSIDGYISGPSDDISAFPHVGPMVEAYMARLTTYSACLMGRRTYEFGYQFGLKPGQNPYPHMTSYVISSSLNLPESAEVEVIRTDLLATVDRIKAKATGPVYLCGGGVLAGALARAGRIDILRLKRQPIILGSGTPLFAPDTGPLAISAQVTTSFEGGGIYQEITLTR